MATTYTVKKGDTLSGIAVSFADIIEGSTIWERVKTLVNLNNIKDANFIVIGQVLKLTGEKEEAKTNTTSRATIDVFGLQSNTDRTVYATWTWDKDHTKHYEVMWYYDTGDNVWFIGDDSEVEDNQSTYNAPSNAKRVKFKVKPISESKNSNNSDATYWTAGWSTEKIYNFSDNPPVKPSAPTVEIKLYTLTAELHNINLNASHIQFQIVKDDATVFNTGTATVVTNHAAYSCTIDASSKYKVRCRAQRGNLYSDWSEYSSNVSSIPSAPSGITVCRAASSESVYLEWGGVNSAETYDLEYTTKKEYFDGSNQTTTESGIEFTKYTLTGLETGKEYFFRVRAVKGSDKSPWSGITSVIIGKKPAAPTTWSNETSVITGDSLNLYWMHNSEDGSDWTYSDLEVYVDGVSQTIKDIQNPKNPDDESEERLPGTYSIDTSQYFEGTTIEWRVRTAGVTKEYGDWSIQRTVHIYAPPTLELRVTDVNENSIDILESFPFYVYGLAGPQTQVPIGYYLTVTANEGYETVDNTGKRKVVSPGEQVYFKHFDTSESLLLEMSASHMDLENNIRYTVACTVSMDSGLSAKSSCEFVVAWTDEAYEPNAEIAIDKETYTASIRPYCMNARGGLLEDVLLSVYRREFDGKFTELATGLDNVKNICITDPHPALDFARYRIVAITKSTGAVSYTDISGYEVCGDSVIIQWNEEWSYFDTSSEDEMEKPVWSGSLLKLPYNIDVSDSNDADVSLVEYIGREHPVTYYGTQKGSKSTWNVAVPKDDKETLYALRRLAIWMGDVYVREPSGSGYWANISVSFSQKHLELTIPVTLNVTRVEGGV